MNYPKKSLGQNFLIDKNIIRKIINLVNIRNKDIVEIGPGKGSLTNEILKKKPNSLILIEKDNNFFNELKDSYLKNKHVSIFNNDILKFDLEKIMKKDSIVFGNLPYNISSQILVKILKFKKWPPKFNDLIFMFQKELGEKIIGKFLSPHYSRLSILSNYRLKIIEKILVSKNCFIPKPKVNSIILHFQPKKNKLYNIKRLSNLEKVTNIIFSNKRKMINKNIKKLLNDQQIKEIFNLKLNLRPADIKPDIYYKIAELFEKGY